MPKIKAPKTGKERIAFLKRIHSGMQDVYEKNFNHWDDVYNSDMERYSMKVGAMILAKVLKIMGYGIKMPYIDSVRGDDLDDTIGAVMSIGEDLISVFWKICDYIGLENDETDVYYFADDTEKLEFGIPVPDEVYKKVDEYHATLKDYNIEYFSVEMFRWPNFFQKVAMLKEEDQEYILSRIRTNSLGLSPFYVNFYNCDRQNMFRDKDDLYYWCATGTCIDSGEDVECCHTNPSILVLYLLIYEMFKEAEKDESTSEVA